MTLKLAVSRSRPPVPYRANLLVVVLSVRLFACSDDEGRELYRKRGSEFKLPYPIIDINGCDSPQSAFGVSNSASDDKAPSIPILRPVASRKSSSSSMASAAGLRNARRRKKDSSLIGLYPGGGGGGEIKSCADLMHQYDTGIAGAIYRGTCYPDVTAGYGDYGRIQPMMLGRRADYGDEDATRMRHDVTDYRGYYDNGATPSAAGAGAWCWASDGTQLASYLYDQQRYLADYSVYGRLVSSPPPSLSNGYDALPVATADALYEAPTPPEDDDNCLQTMTTIPRRPHDIDTGCRRGQDADPFVVNSNNITSTAAATSAVNGPGPGGYGVATPVIQMTAKSRYVRRSAAAYLIYCNNGRCLFVLLSLLSVVGV